MFSGIKKITNVVAEITAKMFAVLETYKINHNTCVYAHSTLAHVSANLIFAFSNICVRNK